MPPKFQRSGNASAPSGAVDTRGRAKNAEADEEEVSLVNAKRFAEISRRAELDVQMGFPSMLSGACMGWMVNMQPVRMASSMT